jgi:uncharacterized membrane protein YebE (DUF533 family)
MLSGLGKGAALGGLLAVLLGTRTGRRVTGSAVKLGGLAAIGGLAYTTLRDWQARQGAAQPAPSSLPIDQLTGPASEQRSLALLKAMIGAAKADGHVDEQEQAQIDRQLERLAPDPGTREFLQQELAKPLRAAEIAANADSPETAIEMYLVSLAVIDRSNELERSYLNDLAKELKLAPTLIETLELRVSGAGEIGVRG